MVHAQSYAPLLSPVYCLHTSLPHQIHPTTGKQYFEAGDPRAELVIRELDPRIHFALVRAVARCDSTCSSRRAAPRMQPRRRLWRGDGPLQVCGARGCPPVRVYTADNLEYALNSAATSFCGDNVSTVVD